MLRSERDAALGQVDAFKKKLKAAEKNSEDALVQARIEIQNREDRIKTLEKESRGALEKAKAEAQKREKEVLAASAQREEQLEGRLRVLAEALSGEMLTIVSSCVYLCFCVELFVLRCAGAIGVPLTLKDQVRNDSLMDMVATVEGCGAQTQVLLAKVKEILDRIHFNVLPKKDVPKTLRALVEALGTEEDPFLGYSRDQTRMGATMAMSLAMAHGIKGDFEKATSVYPMARRYISNPSQNGPRHAPRCWLRC